MKYPTLSLVLICGLASGISSGQTVQFRVPIFVNWGNRADTLYVGVNSGNGTTIQASTYGVDDATLNLFGVLGEYGEAPSPPPDAEGNRIRLVDVKGHTEINSQGGLFRYDFRPYVSSAQVDTFAAEIAGPIAEGNDVHLSWNANLGLYATEWRMCLRTFQGDLTPVSPESDMLKVTGYTFSAAGATVRFGIIKVGANAVTDVAPVDAATPSTYSLSQNYPNPFNPSTEIRFSIPEAGRVKLAVYNLLGQQVATLVDQDTPAGEYKVSFDAARLASGIYLYRLDAGSYSAVNRMVLVR